MKTGVIIVAAGRSARLGGDLPKQYRLLGGKSVLERTLECFLSHEAIAKIQVVIHQDDLALYNQAIAEISIHKHKLCPPVWGGATRQESVYAGIKALQSVDVVLIHDAARPNVSAELINRAINSVQNDIAAVPGTPVTDTIKQVDDNGRVIATPDRNALRAVQTPQAFRQAVLQQAHHDAQTLGRNDFTDDGALMEWAGHSVTVFEGDPLNIKLTYQADFEKMEQTLEHEGHHMITRTGLGYDVHALTEGDHVWIGGVKIPHNKGVLAHSDGDVVLHALTDAVLGAIADGDIGTHFPPSDPQWKGASSDRFLAFACQRVRDRGGIIDHLDTAMMCEAPKLSPYREEIRKRIAEIAGIPESSVSIKATTMEKLGFIGRHEGLAAQSVATIRIPENF
ncbi:bifunctional 2-C-methyl-D-erythritol 4-phosphate cytidylyltransferase/2-C-methyl-D-erythritol 2,4-cyclodiphosphate synthase [Microvirga sp. W0021]|uniref:Bifunctional enzyme IspD/IspF n=1 Tax=Hohaiivirga grylli TaxID=3133970 RepID=A0ABV0BJ82_9HYPH